MLRLLMPPDPRGPERPEDDHVSPSRLSRSRPEKIVAVLALLLILHAWAHNIPDKVVLEECRGTGSLAQVEK